MKTTTATTSIEVNCTCPYCDNYQDLLGENSDIAECMGDDHTAEDINYVCTCEECKKEFTVTDIYF